MAPEFIHWKSSRMFFHLPDAAQGVRSTTFTNLEVPWPVNAMLKMICDGLLSWLVVLGLLRDTCTT